MAPMDRFLEEQLKRIREFTRKVSGLESRSAELTHAIERDREAMRRDPLHEVRDVRTLPRPSHRDDDATVVRRRRKRRA